MPGVPFLYYGDEIGMRYLADVRTKEGGFQRTGSRSPMQWDKNEKNFGFSDAAPKNLYIPQDYSENAPSVAEAEKDPDSILHTVRSLIALRHAHEDLQADADFEVIYEKEGERAFVYRRGNILLAVNPSGEAVKIPVSELNGDIANTVAGGLLFGIGKAAITAEELTLGAQSFGVWE